MMKKNVSIPYASPLIREEVFVNDEVLCASQDGTTSINEGFTEDEAYVW